MEEQLSLLDKYFQLYDDKNYQEKIYEFSYNSIIGHFIEYKIYNYDNGNITDQDVINEKLENNIIEIKDLKSKTKLIPLILFLGEEYWKHLMGINYFDDIYLFLLEGFKSLSFKIDFNKTNEFSHAYESQQDLINGIEKKEFKTITHFNINPNIGNHQYNNFIYLIANKYFFEEYCHALDKKDDFTFLFFLSSLEHGCTDGFDKRLRILEFLSSNKSLLLIKLLDDILLQSDNEDFICKTIIEFSVSLELWQQFINFYLEYPSRYPKLFKPLSKVMTQLDVKNVDLLLHGIRLSKFFSNESQEALNSCFLNIKKEEMRKYCLETLFQRWLDFIDTSCDYFGSIVLTDIIDLVIAYIRDTVDKKVIVQELEQIMYNVEEIDNKWFIDRLEYSNYFYKLITKLFVYGFALEKYELNDLKEKMSIICSRNTILKNEKNYQNKTTLQLFEEYII